LYVYFIGEHFWLISLLSLLHQNNTKWRRILSSCHFTPWKIFKWKYQEIFLRISKNWLFVDRQKWIDSMEKCLQFSHRKFAEIIVLISIWTWAIKILPIASVSRCEPLILLFSNIFETVHWNLNKSLIGDSVRHAILCNNIVI